MLTMRGACGCAVQLLDTAAVVGADTQAQAVSLMFRVHLPSSVSTMMRGTMQSCGDELCVKRHCAVGYYCALSLLA